jgi:hypothetical protein
MAIPPRLEKELAELREQYTIETIEDSSFINLIFKDFPLGDGFNLPTSDLLLMIPKTYPDTGPDMFWVDQQITLTNGLMPQAAESIEQYMNRTWRRFSWHRSPWNPTIDNMHNHMEFIHKRLRDKV